jgi:hypothetical protein
MLACEFARRGLGVRVNAVCPGYFPSGMTPIVGEEALVQTDNCRNNWGIPFGRAGNATDYAQCILGLAVNQYVTGAEHVIDGAWLLDQRELYSKGIRLLTECSVLIGVVCSAFLVSRGMNHIRRDAYERLLDRSHGGVDQLIHLGRRDDTQLNLAKAMHSRSHEAVLSGLVSANSREIKLTLPRLCLGASASFSSFSSFSSTPDLLAW